MEKNIEAMMQMMTQLHGQRNDSPARGRSLSWQPPIQEQTPDLPLPTVENLVRENTPNTVNSLT